MVSLFREVFFSHFYWLIYVATDKFNLWNRFAYEIETTCLFQLLILEFSVQIAYLSKHKLTDTKKKKKFIDQYLLIQFSTFVLMMKVLQLQIVSHANNAHRCTLTFSQLTRRMIFELVISSIDAFNEWYTYTDCFDFAWTSICFFIFAYWA